MSQPTNPQAQNPELGLGDLLKLGQALAEAILTGATETPVLTIRALGKTVEWGPAPLKIK